MGVLLKWKKITSEASYDTVRIYKATGETATYSLLDSQSIEDNSYYDSTGLSSSWYKIDFYDSVGGSVSELSSAIQGGTYYGYCTVDEVRQVTNLKTSDISDTHLATIIEFACTLLNNDIKIYHERERIQYIDGTKENEIDGLNSTFYTKHYYLGDSNNDFRVTISDITVYQVDSEGDETELTVTQVTDSNGQFKVSTAPSTDKILYVSYYEVPRSLSTPDTLIKMASIFLTSAWAYDKINVGKATRFHMGNLTVFRHMDAGHEYYKRYMNTLLKINDKSMVNMEKAPPMPADIIAEMSKSINGV